MRYLPVLFCAIFVIAGSAHATEVSGELTTTTWTVANSPYVVVDMISVPAGVTLTIEPSVEVQVAAGVPISIYGTLLALGTESDSISFAPAQGSPWRGIRIRPGGEAVIAYADVGYASNPQPDDYEWGQGGAFMVESGRLELSHSIIHNSDAALGGAVFGYRNAEISAEYCVFSQNMTTTGTIHVREESSARFSHCLWDNNQVHHVGSAIDAYDHTEVLVDNSVMRGGRHISDTAGEVISVKKSSRTVLDHCLIVDNEVGETAVIQGMTTLLTMIHCTVSGNGGESVIEARGMESLKLDGNILWGNTSDTLVVLEYPHIRPDVHTVRNTILGGTSHTIYAEEETVDTSGDYAPANMGNLIADPLFTAPEASDYTLQPGSPAIDAAGAYLLDDDASPADMGYYGGTSVAPIPRITVDADTVVITPTRTAIVTIRNDGGADLNISNLTVPSSFSINTSAPQIVAPGSELELEIAFIGTMQADGVLVIDHDDAYQDTLRVAVVGTMGTGVSGSLSGVWTKDASPYRLIGTVIVEAGQTLTIEPGVDVLADATARIEVFGSLQAVGTSSDSIRFLPGLAEEWYGLTFEGGDSSTIHWARISGATFDISASSGGGGDRSGAIDIWGADTHLGLAHTVLSNNTGNTWAGIQIYDGPFVTMEDCEISRNNGGGVLLVGASLLSMDRCIIEDNVSDGEGVGLFVNAHDAGASIISNTTVRRNHTTNSGAVVLGHGRVTMLNCSIVDNVAVNEGGGVVLSFGDFKFINCTIAGNTTEAVTDSVINYLPSDGIYSAGSNVLLHNTILWGNGREYSDKYWDDPTRATSITASFCDIAGGMPGDNMLDIDPPFSDAENGDYQLASGSSLIDSGDPESPLDPDGTRSDIGASAHVLPSARIAMDLVLTITGIEQSDVAPPRFNLNQNVPNPFNPTTTIRFIIPIASNVRLHVYDVTGRRIATLIDRGLSAGEHSVVWSGRDDMGRSVASGVYVVRLVNGEFSGVRRMVLLR
jgi:hypothetical protein